MGGAPFQDTLQELVASIRAGDSDSENDLIKLIEVEVQRRASYQLKGNLVRLRAGATDDATQLVLLKFLDWIRKRNDITNGLRLQRALERITANVVKDLGRWARSRGTKDVPYLEGVHQSSSTDLPPLEQSLVTEFNEEIRPTLEKVCKAVLAGLSVLDRTILMLRQSAQQQGWSAILVVVNAVADNVDLPRIPTSAACRKRAYDIRQRALESVRIALGDWLTQKGWTDTRWVEKIFDDVTERCSPSTQSNASTPVEEA